jgi:hypothetical protein
MNKILITTILIFLHLASAGQQLFLRDIDEQGTHVDFNELRFFLDTADRTDFRELRISFHDSVIFQNISPFSKTRLEMETNQELLLTLETSVPIDTSWESIDILAIKISQDELGNLIMKPYPIDDHLKPSERKISQTLRKRIEMLLDTNYTTEEWNQISKRESETVLRLCGELFHCAFYENDDCLDSFHSIQSDFNVMYAGYLAETYAEYQEILRIKNTLPNTK